MNKLVIALIAVAGGLLLVYWPIDAERKQNHRNLRFFDPDHRTCGQSRIAHDFAIHCLYGARYQNNEMYYMRKTVSTDRSLPRDSGPDVDKILKVLAFVAKRTNRAIRIDQTVLPGYNSEHLQPYSIVSAEALQDAGAEVVEQNYWSRALQAQSKSLIGKTNLTVTPAQGLIGYLSSLPESPPPVDDYSVSADDVLDTEDTPNATAIVPLNQTNQTETEPVKTETRPFDPFLDSDELVFQILDIMDLSDEDLETVTGITESLVCTGEHPNPIAIPKANDAFSK